MICAALDNGLPSVIPVKDLEKAWEYKNEGYLVAAERKGALVEGFDLTNSPLEFGNYRYKGYTLVLTTSNGTMALENVKEGPDEILVGSFVNAEKVLSRLRSLKKSVLLVCAGWRNYFNLEDSFLAGYLVHEIMPDFRPESDGAMAMKALFEANKPDWYNFLMEGSHPQRLKGTGKTKDLAYCLSFNQSHTLPVYKAGEIIPFKPDEK